MKSLLGENVSVIKWGHQYTSHTEIKKLYGNRYNYTNFNHTQKYYVVVQELVINKFNKVVVIEDLNDCVTCIGIKGVEPYPHEYLYEIYDKVIGGNYIKPNTITEPLFMYDKNRVYGIYKLSAITAPMDDLEYKVFSTKNSPSNKYIILSAKHPAASVIDPNTNVIIVKFKGENYDYTLYIRKGDYTVYKKEKVLYYINKGIWNFK